MKNTFESRGIQKTEDLSLIEDIKAAASQLEDLYLKIIPNNESVGPECGRLISVARTNLEQSVMWAVKAVSRK
jgi:hypothetical protein